MLDVAAVAPEANATAATGELRRYHPGESEPYLIFRYRVVRAWQEPLDRFLKGPLGTLPLAALTDEAKADLIGTVNRINERLKGLPDAATAGRMQAGMMLLLGLRYTEGRIAEVRKGIEMVDLRESSFYKLVHEEGRVEEARRMILSLGTRKFGPSTREAESTLEGIADQAKLESIAERLFDATSWEDLLAGA